MKKWMLLLSALTLPLPAVTVFTTGFESGIPSAVTGAATLASAAGYDPSVGMQTQYIEDRTFSSAVNIGLTALAAHSSSDISFTFAAIATWDGSLGGHCCNPDYLFIQVDGTNVGRVSAWGGNAAAAEDATFFSPATGISVTPLFPSGNTNGATVWNVQVTGIAHSASTMSINFLSGGAGWQGYPDEYFGLDNIAVTTNANAGAVPEPTSFAMLAGGAALIGLLRRRR